MEIGVATNHLQPGLASISPEFVKVPEHGQDPLAVLQPADVYEVFSGPLNRFIRESPPRTQTKRIADNPAIQISQIQMGSKLTKERVTGGDHQVSSPDG
jgi:hypothetical protein